MIWVEKKLDTNKNFYVLQIELKNKHKFFY